MTTIVYRHHSMKWSASTDQAVKVIARHRAHADVVSGTEGNGLRWAYALGTHRNGWSVRHERGEFCRGDVWITASSSLEPRKAGWIERLSKVTYDGRSPWCAVQKYKDTFHPEHARIFFLAHHLPAHIEGDLRVKRTTRVRAYLEALPNLRRLVLRIRNEHPGAHIVLAGDWNLNLRRLWVRALLRRTLRGTGLRMVPLPKTGPEGTHGKRLIDWAFTDLEARGVILSQIDGFDHRPVEFELHIPKRSQ